MSELIYDPFKPQFDLHFQGKTKANFKFEKRIGMPVRPVSVLNWTVFLIEGISYLPSMRAFKASKMNDGDIVYEKLVSLRQNPDKSEIATKLLKLTRDFIEETSKYVSKLSPSSSLIIGINRKRNPALSPTLVVQFNLPNRQNVKRVKRLDKFSSYDEAIQFIIGFDRQIQKYLESNNDAKFQFDKSIADPDSSVDDLDDRPYQQKLLVALQKYVHERGFNYTKGIKYAPLQFKELTTAISDGLKAFRVAEHQESSTHSDVISRKQRTTGVVGVKFKLDRRALELYVSAVTGIRDGGFHKEKKFYLSKYKLEEAFKLAKKAFHEAFGLPPQSRQQYLDDFNAFKGRLLLIVPQPLLYQVADGLEGHSIAIAKHSKRPTPIDVGPEEAKWLRFKVRNGGKFKGGQHPNRRKNSSIADLSGIECLDFEEDLAELDANGYKGDNSDQTLIDNAQYLDERLLSYSDEEIQEAYKEAKLLINEINQLNELHLDALNEFKDSDYKYGNFGSASPVDVDFIADCERCGAKASYTATDGKHLVTCTKCTHKGATMFNEWRAKLDWNRKNSHMISLKQIPHFHFKNRTIDNSIRYMESVEKLLFTEIDKQNAKRDLALLQRKYKLEDLAERFSKPGKLFIERLEAYGEWFWISMAVLKRYQLVGKKWNS
ncbi:hypothetical protein RGL50_004134 [Vibrio alginolyticus]|jgi:hypothetical protein|nr:hypothetical protein [Vibrio alginolyticus]